MDSAKNRIDCFVTSIQHIGIPTNDMNVTVDFYESLGFSAVWQTTNKATGEKTAFLRLQNVVLEIYESSVACGGTGAIDHIALDVTDIEAVFAAVQGGPYRLLDKEIQFLPFWENGVRFFTIEGPNREKIEFNQKR